MLETEGARLIEAYGSYDELTRLLAGGAVVALLFDMPGPHETQFLGRPVMLASGTARLAHSADALIVPGRRVLRRYLPVTEFEPAIDPRDYPDWHELHIALAAYYSWRILEDPASLEDPRRPGAWETATADGWPLTPG
jgi:hypothetical protein